MQKHKIIAAILAGGTGSRMGTDEPKQFLMVGDRMVIEHSVDAFEKSPLVDEIIIVSHADHLERMRLVVKVNAWKKVTAVVSGGQERYLSSVAAIRCCEACDEEDLLVIHDAARPFVSQEVIASAIATAREHGTAAVGIPAVDTIWRVENGQTIDHIPQRSHCYQAQTPQVFRLDIVRRAYALALQDPDLQATDDCGIVYRYLPEVPIHVVLGEPENKKVTYRQDLRLSEVDYYVVDLKRVQNE